MLRKNSLRLLLLAVLSIAGSVFTSSPVWALPIDATLAPAHGAALRYAVVVEGLACPFCAYGIEKQFKALPGVDAVSTDIATETVTVTMRPGVGLARAEAADAVKRAGFTLRDFHPVAPGSHP